jgi:hypothetical protein
MIDVTATGRGEVEVGAAESFDELEARLGGHGARRGLKSFRSRRSHLRSMLTLA